jgi:hypothetical protein
MGSHQDFYRVKAKKNIPEAGNGFPGHVDRAIGPLNEETGEVMSVKKSLMPGWRTATLHIIDKSNNRLLLISEPYWVHEENRMAETIRKRLYEIYTAYKLSQASTGDNI